MKKNRQLFFKLALASAVTIAVIGALLTTPAAMGAEKSSLKIGIIGSGNIGSTLGEFWIKAGHEVLFSSRHPEQLQGLVKRLGPKAHAGTTHEAATFGDVILVSVPYAALPEIGRAGNQPADPIESPRAGRRQKRRDGRSDRGRAALSPPGRADVPLEV
jgi:hypothetical protein